ncbi:GNAT family N-acetyltransferase [Gordonia sp. N1V]|uniref:GNAT family N-acetyltransferase n=1 Tax=Gordonia sp. N1V TaxID=3034163 RepID=UPI0023E0EBAE|nr:GNAT family N-acetyltransferase [Gordonia sp. N1V]MDF3283075.1 GNAT family N-acetyltransferase [Gordonia sp. N1V]
MAEATMISECTSPTDVAVLRWAWARETAPEIPAWSADAEFVTEVERWMTAPHRSVWTAVTEVVAADRTTSAAVGMVCLTEYTRMPSPRSVAAESWGYLGHLYVAAEHRGRGIGHDLIEAVLRFADARGYTKVVLSPTSKSVPLYARCGFSTDNDLMVRYR